jgi:acetyl-CoA carboxylase biotin carboxyl carrier protein
MDIRKVKKLIELVEESSIGELEIREGEEYVRIARAAPSGIAAPPAVAQQVGAAAAVEPEAEPEQPEQSGHVIVSPIVGTFYRSSSPGSRAFVDVGSTVGVGDTVCIIEAMKIMNQIDADKAGVVKAILAENGAPVEYGQALIEIG